MSGGTRRGQSPPARPPTAELCARRRLAAPCAAPKIVIFVVAVVVAQLRLALHLNVAACGLRATDVFGETRYHDTISHASRVLEADPSNVKACRALSVKPPVLVPRSLLAVMVVAPSLEARGAACHRRLSFDAVRPTCCGLTTSTASRWRSRRADPPCHPP